MATPSSQRPRVPAAPRDREAPVVLLKVGPPGKPTARLDQSIRIVDFEYEDTCMRADVCKFTVDNYDLANFVADPNFRRGNECEVQWGYAGNMSPPRKLIIRKITGGQQLKVEAISRGILMHREKRRERYEKMTRSQIVRVIAQRNGYVGAQLDVEDTDEVLDVVVQPNLTDAEMLRRLAKHSGKQFFVDFDGLHWHAVKLDQKPIRELRWFTPPAQGEVMSFEIENDITGRPGYVSVKGYDPRKKKAFEGVGSNEQTKRGGLGQTVDVVDKIDVQNAQNLVVETRATAKPTEKSGKVLADKRFAAAQRVNVKLKLELVGDPSLVAKSVVAVTGLGPIVSGNYYVRTVKHKIGSGYKLDVEAVTDRGQAKPSKGKTTPGAADPNKPQERDEIVVGNDQQSVQRTTFVPTGGRK